MELSRLIAILLLACDAISHAHARGAVHGALDPSRIVIGRDGSVSVEDTGPVPRLVSAAYLSTEQAWNRRADFSPRTDVHAFGGMLFAILTSRAPHEQPSFDLQLASARQGLVQPAQAVCPNRTLPAALCRIASRALSASPADRHASIDLLKQDLERFLRSLPTPAAVAETGSLPALSA